MNLDSITLFFLINFLEISENPLTAIEKLETVDRMASSNW